MTAFATAGFVGTMPTAFLDVRHPRDRRVAHPGGKPLVPGAHSRRHTADHPAVPLRAGLAQESRR